MKSFALLLIVLLNIVFTKAAVFDFLKEGGIPSPEGHQPSIDVCNKNSLLLNQTLAALKRGDSLHFPNTTFFFNGHVVGENLFGVRIVVDGTVKFTDDRDNWPRHADGSVYPALEFLNITDVVFTSNGKGTIDGNGKAWWGAIDMLRYGENRPRLMHIKPSKNIIVENLLFKNSAYWTFWAEECDGLIVRYSDIDVRWDNKDIHGLLDLQAFNTDGFDVTGQNVHMHDLNIWNDDDCIAVKDGSQNMLFERINASGLGLVIGSIGNSKVKNITFKDSVMYNTFKGIYLKTRYYDAAPIGDAASISDILYQNITIYNPEQWAIWIGPAQQTGQQCPLYWPAVPHSTCNMSGYQTWSNITLRDIKVYNSRNSPGVLIGNSTNPITGLTFENVVFENPGSKPWGDDFYECDNIVGTATGTTWPVPKCFKDETIKGKQLRGEQ